MKLVVIRHGQSEWNELNLFTGWTDVELTDLGRSEALQGGQALVENGFDFDVVYTSYLKRAIHTMEIVLNAMDRNWLPIHKDWRLNERHYGALQGLNKKETAEKYGDDQVLLWRRSYDVLPPILEVTDERAPQNIVSYRAVEDKDSLPLHESLKETVERVIPYFENTIKHDMKDGKRVLIVAHGNSLRALHKYFLDLSNEAIIDVNIPTGVPLVYEFDESFTVVNHYYLEDEAKLKEKMDNVKNQGTTK